VDCAVESGVFSGVVVSSERDLRPDLPEPVGFHQRPVLLSQPGVGVMAVVMAILTERKFADETFCVLWPTTPTRTPEVLRAMRKTFYAMVSLHSVFAQRDPCGHWRHDGTALFMDTLEFLRRFTLDLGLDDPVFPVTDSVDVNTAEDLARAEAVVRGRRHAVESAA
jgi:hypothetical protein